MDTPRYTITRARDRVPVPWRLTRSTAGGVPDRLSRHWTHADAVAMMDRLSGYVVPLPQALREGRAYGHTLVVGEDPAAARRRALKARRMAARRRARPVRVVPVWEPASARLERAAGEWGALARSARASTRADFTLAAPSNGGR